MKQKLLFLVFPASRIIFPEDLYTVITRQNNDLQQQQKQPAYRNIATDSGLDVAYTLLLLPCVNIHGQRRDPRSTSTILGLVNM